MLIIPAIDLKDGKVVRLLKGDFNTVQQVADDPVATAKAFYEAGARYLHIVDLDGSKDGVRKNSELVRAVVGVGLKTELGGGIRSMQDLEEVFALGIWRAIIGSAAVSDPDFVKAALEKYGPDFVKAAVDRFGPERIAVGVDAKDGLVRTAGWVKESGENYLDFAKRMEQLGVRNIIFTDIDTDGMQTGPSFARLKFLLEGVSCSVTAAGDQKSRQAVHRVRRDHPEAVVAVCGCWSQTHAAEARALGADVLTGTGERMGFLSLLERAVREHGPERGAPLEAVDPPFERRHFEWLPAGGLEGRTRALLKVEDGCANFCSYCIIPYARGPVRSLPLGEAAEQVRRLAEEGCREVVLTGREPARWMAEAAHYSTEMTCHRHPYQDGVPAREGVEF